MVDNVSITAGAGTIIGTEDIGGGVQIQRVKMQWGGAGTAAEVANATPLPVNIIPNGGQGASRYYRTSTATTNADTIVGAAATLYHISATNTNASVRYLRLYNKASNPTVGSDAVVHCWAIPGNGGIVLDIANGWRFTTGIALSLTTGAADSNTSAVAADEIKINAAYV